MDLKSKLSNIWDIIKGTCTEAFIIKSEHKYHKELLHVNRHKDRNFDRFLSAYNYLSIMAIFLSVMTSTVDFTNGNFILALLQLIITWMLYVSRIKGLSHLAKFFYNPSSRVLEPSKKEN